MFLSSSNEITTLLVIGRKDILSKVLGYIANVLVELANSIYTSGKHSFRIPVLTFNRTLSGYDCKRCMRQMQFDSL